MSEIPVGDLKTGDVTWAVTVDTQHHTFTARADGFSQAHGNDWAAMERSAKVMASRARVRVAVEYAHIGWLRELDRPVIKTGTANGLHAVSRHILASEDGRAVQIGVYGHDYFRPPSPEDGKRMTDITATIRELTSELRTLTRKYEFPAGDGSLGDQVRHEIDQARAAKNDG